MEQQEIDKLTIFRSYYDALKQRNDEDFATMFRAIFEYGFQGVEPTFEDASLAAIFTLIRPVLKRSIARAAAGASGGRSGAGVARNFGNNHASKNNSKNNSIEAAEKEKEKEEGIGEGEGNMDKEKKRFTRPTVEEVRAYCIERNNGIDAQAFVDFYESKGWKVGNASMKDWKACVRTWERRDGRKGTKEGVLLGVDEWIDGEGNRRYGTGNMPPVPMGAPPRPNKNTIFSRESNTWIPAGL